MATASVRAREEPQIDRRGLLAAGGAAAAALLLGRTRAAGHGVAARKAQIAVTLDLEMSRNFPTWDATHWDYEKGNLDEPTKRYALEAARRVVERGGLLHLFVVGRVFEQEDIEWLREIAELGCPLGNHTYDHVNVKATEAAQTQFRFQRAPWLVGGRSAEELIRDNIRLTELALQERLNLSAAGFRTPGGFHNGLDDRRDVQQMLLALGYRWVSSRYPAHRMTAWDERPDEAVFDSIVTAQAEAQPSIYPSGLIEVPMSPVSDITAFRGGRWPLDDFVEATRRAVEWAIEEGAAYDFLGHPSCLVVTDPEFRTLDTICDLVEAAGERAEFADLDRIAQRAAAGEASRG